MNRQNSTETGAPSSRKALILVFFITLVDQIGWGMVIPILPTYSKTFQANAVVIGLLLASYSLIQFFFAPALGRWSDRIGRKPVLLLCLLGSALASVATGAASLVGAPTMAILVLFLARMLDGATGGNTGIAMSYASDVTTPEKRAHGLGLIGAAIGLGYTIGPALGGVIAHFSNAAIPFYVAGGIAFVNMLVMAVILPESLKPEQKVNAKNREARSINVFDGLRKPNVGSLLFINFLFIFAASCYQMMMPLYTNIRFNFGERENSYLFAFLGLTMTIVQGGLIRPLVKKWGETAILFFGLSVMTATLAVAPAISIVSILVWLTGGMAIGTALCNPSVLALISKQSDAEEQGEALGYAASMASLARILAPAWCGYAMKNINPASPFFTGALFSSAALILFALTRLRKVPTPVHPS